MELNFFKLPPPIIGLHIRGDRASDIEGLIIHINLIEDFCNENLFHQHNEEEQQFYHNWIGGWESSIFVSVGKNILEKTCKSSIGSLKPRFFLDFVKSMETVKKLFSTLPLLEETFTFHLSLKTLSSFF